MTRRGWILFVLLSVVWGIPYLLIKVAVAELPVPVLVFARVALAAAVLLPLAFREGGRAVLLRHWKPLAAFAVLEFVIPWGLLFHAEIRLSSSTAGLLMASIPVLGVVLGKLGGDRERLGALRLTGLVTGFAGVFVLAAPALNGDLLSVVEALVAALCYAAAAVIAAKHLRDVPALPMVAVCLTFASVVYLPFAMTSWPTSIPSLPALASVLGLALVCTALAFVWFFALIREVGLNRALVITYVNPAVAVAAGAIVLSEPLHATTIVAFTLIMVGSALATARGRVRETQEQAVV